MNYNESVSPSGGILWTSDNLAYNDAGKSIVEAFIKKYPHHKWTLSIYDASSQTTIEIDCKLADMPRIVSYIYNIEHAAPMMFIGENPMAESYVVGMTCTRGRIEIPGAYKVQDGKLITLENK